MRLAQLALALLITAKLIDWKTRYTPTNQPLPAHPLSEERQRIANISPVFRGALGRTRTCAPGSGDRSSVP